MDEVTAKSVISSRKRKRDGYVDRKVVAKVKFRITDVRDSNEHDRYYSKKQNRYEAQIVDLMYQL
jgi:hypothetical protein